MTVTLARLSLTLPLTLALALAHTVHADTGMLRAHVEETALHLTVFTEPTPVRVGLLDLSALVLDPSGDALPDAVVLATLTPPDGPAMHVTLDNAQATTAFMRAANCTLEQSGTWQVELVATNGTEQVRAAFPLQVAPPLPPLLALWPWLIPAPIALGLWMSARKSPGTVHPA